MIRLLKRIFILGLLLLSVAVFGAWQYLQYWLNTPMAIPKAGIVYQLKAGQSLGHLVHDFAEKGALQNPKILLLYSRLTNKTEVHAGEYQIAEGCTPLELLAILNKGDVVVYSATLVEGWTFRQAIAALSELPKLNSQLSGLSVAEQMQRLALPIDHPEGWFFPDTYQYTAGTTDIALLRRAYKKMSLTVEALWLERDENLPYKNPYEAMIMASIVERETGAAWEREKIAGVFVSRLKKGMRLQTDPTVIYGMGERYQGNIRRKDLQAHTPYNTYTIKGLPPTPIALAGREALYASLHPAVGNDLYFVAKGDGTHVFSATLAEHNKAVRAYQLKRRKDYRSSVTTGAAN